AILQCSFLSQLAASKPVAPNGQERRVECCGIPLKPERGLTPISCHAALERSACAPFIKGKAHGVYQRHKPPQEIGAMGHPMFVAGAGSRWADCCTSYSNQKTEIVNGPESDFILRWTWLPENGIDTTTDA